MKLSSFIISLLSFSYVSGQASEYDKTPTTNREFYTEETLDPEEERFARYDGVMYHGFPDEIQYRYYLPRIQVAEKEYTPDFCKEDYEFKPDESSYWESEKMKPLCSKRDDNEDYDFEIKSYDGHTIVGTKENALKNKI